MYSREQIDQVRTSLDMVEVIREYVPSLKSSGRSVRGLCPFHSERTPSFHVHPEKGIFKCFGCGEAGDIIGFLAKIEQVGFSEALEKLADRAGIRLKKRDDVGRREPEGIREKLHRVLSAACRCYEEALWDERHGAGARNYLERRGVSEETAKLFHLGVASVRGTAVFEQLVKKGFPIELCQQAGLTSRSSNGRFYDPLFGRLIFPIHDNFGHVIGFGGRVLPDSKQTLFGAGSDNTQNDGPKYLNSPETPVFSKGKSLYGLFQAKPNIMSTRSVIILEGYMDVIGLVQGGVHNAVATLGTAFTRDHARSLKRYAVETAYAFFDPDEAGQKAALRSLPPILQEDIFPRVVVTKGNADPDELILIKGKDNFDSLITSAPDFVDYLLQVHGALGTMSLQQKSIVAHQLIDVIGKSSNDILRAEWLHRVAERLGLRSDSLEQELRKNRRNEIENSPGRKAVIKELKEKNTLPTAEEELFQLLLAVPETWIGLDVHPHDFLEENHRHLFSMMKEQQSRNGRLSVPALSEDMSDEFKGWLWGLSVEEREFSDPMERRDQLIRDIRLKRTRERLRLLQQRVAAGQANTTEQNEYRDLLRRVKGSPVSTYGEQSKSHTLS